MNNQIDPQRNELPDWRINKKYQNTPNGKLPPSEMVPDWIKEVWTRLLNFVTTQVNESKVIKNR